MRRMKMLAGVLAVTLLFSACGTHKAVMTETTAAEETIDAVQAAAEGGYALENVRDNT